MINRYHALALNLATAQELDQITDMAFRINDILRQILLAANIRLIDFKLEFGRLPDGTIILADEISPDTCRFWDATTGAHLDKDLFRRDLGGRGGRLPGSDAPPGDRINGGLLWRSLQPGLRNGYFLRRGLSLSSGYPPGRHGDLSPGRGLPAADPQH